MEASEVCTAKWETTAAHAFWASINNEMCICRKGKQTLKWEHCKEGPERGLSAGGRPKVQHPVYVSIFKVINEKTQIKPP